MNGIINIVKKHSGIIFKVGGALVGLGALVIGGKVLLGGRNDEDDILVEYDETEPADEEPDEE